MFFLAVRAFYFETDVPASPGRAQQQSWILASSFLSFISHSPSPLNPYTTHHYPFYSSPHSFALLFLTQSLRCWVLGLEMSSLSRARYVQTCKMDLNHAHSIPQTVLITGGSDGMGKAVALELAAKGANVVVVARTVSKLEATVDEMKVR